MKQDRHIARNPYSIKHPQWKHWSLGVLVFRGALTAEQVVSWEADSPASTAFWQGHEAARRAEALFLEDGDDGRFCFAADKEPIHAKFWNPIQAHINANREEDQ